MNIDMLTVINSKVIPAQPLFDDLEKTTNKSYTLVFKLLKDQQIPLLIKCVNYSNDFAEEILLLANLNEKVKFRSIFKKVFKNKVKPSIIILNTLYKMKLYSVLIDIIKNEENLIDDVIYFLIKIRNIDNNLYKKIAIESNLVEYIAKHKPIRLTLRENHPDIYNDFNRVRVKEKKHRFKKRK